MFSAAVTGTNGKTSTIEYARQLLALGSRRAVSVGTLGTTDEEGSRPTPFFLSEPGCWGGHLEELGFDCDAAVLEAFSAGLSLGEWDGAPLSAAVLTTLGRDHLDFHGTEARYAQAKLRLFRRGLPRGATAIVNTSCPIADEVVAIGRSRRHDVVRYGRGGDIRFVHTSAVPGGFDATISAFGATYAQRIAVPARFLADNALAAVGIAVAAGIEVSQAIAGLASLGTPPGRMELAGTPAGAQVFVDYAHSPDALAVVLAAARACAAARVLVIFGCGGERDRPKRAEMGRIARRRADVVIVTDDNPRSEAPEAIRADIRRGCPSAYEIGGRREAIETGVGMLRRGDVLLICGKGCETEQVRGETRHPWDDRAEARRASVRRPTARRRSVSAGAA